jgi:hypothetical protein
MDGTAAEKALAAISICLKPGAVDVDCALAGSNGRHAKKQRNTRTSIRNANALFVSPLKSCRVSYQSTTERHRLRFLSAATITDKKLC